MHHTHLAPEVKERLFHRCIPIIDHGKLMVMGRQAYGTLGDPEQRRRYDDSGRYDGMAFQHQNSVAEEK